ncbi:MAG: hypothetical protein CL867_05225 [Cytophagaceae bacterium]|nr:hypothetical protein [Cytophagaceae bacterium]
MKNLMIAVLFLASITAVGQSSHFGIKGGLNFGSTGELSGIFDRPIDADNKVGYHLGAFGHVEFLGLFLQPEVVYTRLNSEYKRSGTSADYNLSKLDIPVLLGLDILGPINIKAGPSFQVVLNNELDGAGVDIEEPENTFTVGYQLGVGVTLGQLGLDLRYEGAFQENETFGDQTLQDAGFVLDSRPSQWILSLSYAFDSK